jgi:hypothetical protein
MGYVLVQGSWCITGGESVDAAAERWIPNNGKQTRRDLPKKDEAGDLSKLGWRITNLGMDQMRVLFDRLAPRNELYDSISGRGGLRKVKGFGIAC